MAPQDVEVADAHTFLFADMVGFTAMTEVCGDEAAARAATDFYAAVRGMLRHHDAEEVKTIGDALGHQNPQSTFIYTKAAVDDIRSVSLDITEVLP